MIKIFFERVYGGLLVYVFDDKQNMLYLNGTTVEECLPSDAELIPTAEHHDGIEHDTERTTRPSRTALEFT